MEKQESAFGIDGIGGGLLATGLLLAVLAYLSYLAIVTQQATAQQSYEIVDPLNIEMKSTDNEKHLVIHGDLVGGDGLHKYQVK